MLSLLSIKKFSSSFISNLRTGLNVPLASPTAASKRLTSSTIIPILKLALLVAYNLRIVLYDVNTILPVLKNELEPLSLSTAITR